jgi:hypothetical protein
MATDETDLGYVITSDGAVFLQVPDEDNPWGFCLCDDDRSWPGGLGVASAWEGIADDDPRITAGIRSRLQPFLDGFRQPGA